MILKKEEFLNTIYSIPSWVNSSEDLHQYAAHLHFRLIQSKSCEEHYSIYEHYYNTCSYDSEIPQEHFQDFDHRNMGPIFDNEIVFKRKDS
jgi:hypothetical protein